MGISGAIKSLFDAASNATSGGQWGTIMKHTFRIALWLGTVALVAAHVSVAFAATNIAPTTVVSQEIRTSS